MFQLDNTSSPDQVTFTMQEREILRFLVQGATNAELSKSLFIAENTVKNYMTDIFRKIGVFDRLNAALWAIKHCLFVDVDEIAKAVREKAWTDHWHPAWDTLTEDVKEEYRQQVRIALSIIHK